MPIVQRVRPRLARQNTPALIEALGHGEFEGYASLFSVADGAGDVVAPGAFARSLKRRGPDRVRMLYQHHADEPLGVWETIAEDGKGLYVRGRLNLDVERARDVGSLIAQGALNGLSIGFRAIRARRDRATGQRLLNEIDLWEISVVTFPLLPGSEVTAIGAKAREAELLKRAAHLLRSTPLSSPPFAVEGDRLSGPPPPRSARHLPRNSGGGNLKITPKET
ncbi:MAG: HK97 family phage prohead protease [Rhizomicrobium sp.]